MATLHSHYPALLLADHITAVHQAEEAILRRHTAHAALPSPQWLRQAALWHDAGKSSRMFQAYITDPARYREDPDLKSHTPLSLLVTLLQSAAADWDPLETLAVALAVRGHHGRLPILPDPACLRQPDPHELDQIIINSKLSRILKEQLATLDAATMDATFGLPVSSALQGAPAVLLRRANQRIRAVFNVWNALSFEDRLTFRLQTQFLFSVLLEADKALLAIHDAARYLTEAQHDWNPLWVDDAIARKPSGHLPTQAVRRAVRDTVMATLDQGDPTARLFSLTAPTGIGKTFLAASWALKLRAARQQWGDPTPQIIVVLPFLSIIDQTTADYRDILSAASNADPSWLLPAHSLADRDYDQALESHEESFFIDTWRSDVIVTTYDQFLMALFDDRARHQMRFHHLWDALIILDEVQALPPRLWWPLRKALEGLATRSHTQALLMSATLPAIFPDTVPLLPHYPEVFHGFSRYVLQLHLDPCPLDEFVASIITRLPDWLQRQQRVLITLNTRGSARAVRDAIADAWPEGQPRDLFFITADVTPRDRRAHVDAIKHAVKEHRPCIVVSTQTVEAGVDLDMTHVIRDFAPWDSLVQIAGRCNREGSRSREVVEIWNLTVPTNHRKYSDMVYDPIRLKITHQILAGQSEINEEDTLTYSQRYFDQMATCADTGQDYFAQYLQFQPRDSVRELLRGEPRKEYDFLVLDDNPDLPQAIEAIATISDRWERREAWRRLAPALAEVTIHVAATQNFTPRAIGTPITDELWRLNPGHYSPKQGLLIEGDTLIF